MAIAIQTTLGIGLWKDILLLQRQHLGEYHLASGGGPMGFIGEIDDTKKTIGTEPWNHWFLSIHFHHLLKKTIYTHWIGLVDRELCVRNPVWKRIQSWERMFPPILGDIKLIN
jgi:hypothetical protein